MLFRSAPSEPSDSDSKSMSESEEDATTAAAAVNEDEEDEEDEDEDAAEKPMAVDDNDNEEDEEDAGQQPIVIDEEEEDEEDAGQQPIVIDDDDDDDEEAEEGAKNTPLDVSDDSGSDWEESKEAEVMRRRDAEKHAQQAASDADDDGEQPDASDAASDPAAAHVVHAPARKVAGRRVADKGKQRAVENDNDTHRPRAQTTHRRRWTKKELERARAIGYVWHNAVVQLAEELDRDFLDVAHATDILPKYSRERNSWNMWQQWYALHHDKPANSE